MLVEIYEEREKRKAKKEIEENVGKISDLDDIGKTIDELVERIENIKPDFFEYHLQVLKNMKFEIIEDMKFYENENLEIMEIWGGEIC